MRWSIRAHRMFSPATLRLLKRAIGWGSGSRIYRRLALDGARSSAITTYDRTGVS
jgi:hypothetical protein